MDVKGDITKRSWLVDNPFLTAINETIKNNDDVYIKSAVSIWST